MCIILCHTSPPVNPPYALIIAANRDEYIARPTLDAAWHHFEPLASETDSSSRTEEKQNVRCLSGRDAKDPIGGTWFGLSVPENANEEGKKIMRIGALTNIHDDVPLDPGPEGRRSRGGILKDYLQLSNDDDTDEYLHGLREEDRRYEGFGLGLIDVVFDPSGSTSSSTSETRNKVEIVSSYHSNRLSTEPKGSNEFYELKDRSTWGISNSIITKPLAKVKQGNELLSEVLDRPTESSEVTLIEDLFEILRSDNGPINTIKDLHKTIFVNRLKMPPSGLPSGKTPSSSNDAPAERKDDKKGNEEEGRDYGTRLSTVVLVKKDGEVLFVERDRAGEGKEGERRFRFQLGD